MDEFFNHRLSFSIYALLNNRSGHSEEGMKAFNSDERRMGCELLKVTSIYIFLFCQPLLTSSDKENEKQHKDDF